MTAIDLSKIEDTRRFASACIRAVLDESIGKSEAEVAKKLSEVLAQNSALLPLGWYDPPPGGIAVLAADPSDFSRLSFDTLRKENFWPQSDRQINHDSVVVAYVSPVHRSTLLIGDYGCTRYFGSNKRIHDHIARCRSVLNDVARLVMPGIEFREIHKLAEEVFFRAGLSNECTSSKSDPAGMNIGHTIPFSFSEESRPNNYDLSVVREQISKARKFISRTETFCVPRDGAFTLEARLKDSTDESLPNVLIHLIILVQQGQIRILEDE